MTQSSPSSNDNKATTTSERSENRLVGDWKKIKAHLDSRHILLRGVSNELANVDLDDKFMLSTADVFVEKAQLTLTRRAQWMIGGGIFCSAFAMLISLHMAWTLHEISISTLLGKYQSNDVNVILLIILKSSTVAAFAVGVIVFLSKLAFALFHEATVLYNRRHALRFGRLFLYLKKGNVELKDLRDAFQWNDEFATAFKSMSMDIKTPFSKIADIPKETIEGVAELLRSRRPNPQSASTPQGKGDSPNSP